MQNLEKIRKQLEDYMIQDQKFSNPASRKSFQEKVWGYITTNLEIILSDRGDDDKGSYPASPYPTWLLVQHMDAFPDRQRKLLNLLKKSKLNPTDGKSKVGKLQYLEDRCKVNEWILKNYRNEKYWYKGKPLPDPTNDVRNSEYFDDASPKNLANSAKQALKNAEEAGNLLLVDAVKKTNVKTQPSHKS